MLHDNSWARTHPELMELKRLVFDPAGCTYSAAIKDAESQNYGAHHFTVDGAAVQFRVARTTSKKIGQFAAFWKRIGDGPIQPFHVGDDVDLLIVVTRTPKAFGYFEFPMRTLCDRRIVTTDAAEGKRAFRVYPPWDSPTNKTAKAVQAWQHPYFTDLSDRE